MIQPRPPGRGQAQPHSGGAMPLPVALRAFVGGIALWMFSGALLAQTQQLRVAVTTAAENAPFFSADEQGQFAKVGLDVKVEMMPSGVEISNALASGTVDVGLFGTYPFLTAVARGVPVVLLGHTWNSALNNPQSEVLSVIARA